MISILIPCYNYNAYDLVSRLEKECLTLGIVFEIISIDDAINNINLLTGELKTKMFPKTNISII